jgi:hypothetical protein
MPERSIDFFSIYDFLYVFLKTLGLTKEKLNTTDDIILDITGKVSIQVKFRKVSITRFSTSDSASDLHHIIYYNLDWSSPKYL